MKKKFTATLLAIIILSCLLLSSEVLARSSGRTISLTAKGIKNEEVYRLYNIENGEHLYTTSEDEVQNLAQNHGWIYEGIGWYAPRSGDPVYRLFSSVNGNHLYTTDTNEIRVLSSQGWQVDNNSKPLFYSGGNKNIYRLYNSQLNGMHHLTTDSNEYKTLPGNGWKQEGATLHGTTETFEQKYPSGKSNISNVNAQYAIQADVNLTGSGTGYHAKLVAGTTTSAVSFGIQYDKAGKQPYTDCTSFLIENVASNNENGQSYVRTGYSELNRTYRLMLTVNNNGVCDVYINGNKVDSVKNLALAGQNLSLRVEGSGRKNGDSVKAVFSNIKLKNGGSYQPKETWTANRLDTNSGIYSDISHFDSSKRVIIQGTVTGLSSSQDWDSAYNKVSGLVDFRR